MQIYEALFTVYNTVNAFKTAIGSRMYASGSVPENPTYPYAVIDIPSFDNEKYFAGVTIEPVEFQINIVNKVRSVTTMETISQACRDLFDDCTFTLSGYTVCAVDYIRTIAGIDPDERIREWALIFEITLAS